ncbi:MAG: putative alpha/beta superfamily hydrolase [Saprospiraceae bacterium]
MPSITDSHLKNNKISFFLRTQEADERPVYMLGSFNKWKTFDENYLMVQQEPTLYRLDIDKSLLPTIVGYKYTRGDWSSVELTKEDNIAANRNIDLSTIKGHVFDDVSHWRRHWLPYKKPLIPHVELIDEAFEIPQLNKTRKVWALLPYDYYSHPEKRYPVLYLNDAQNLFDENAPYGNWEIDKKLAVLTEYSCGGVIIIAIEHGGKSRNSEYNFGSEQLGSAEGKKYIRFLTDTLKIHIDKHYRTMPEREYTGLGGSSLGGLISIFGGLIYPEVYSKLMIFSPSLWTAKDLSFPHIHFTEKFHTKMYIYSGGQESQNHLKNMLEFREMIKIESEQYADLEIRTSINPTGTHAESFWSDEFPRAIEWLFFDTLEDPTLREIHKEINNI